MIDPELGLAIVFNGCIYNYRELRAELVSAGYRFFSEGDTEVILKAYAHWGVACVERFFGMFAFCLWERDSGRVVLARDRLGIKPLYLSQTADRLRFASTLPALLAAGDVDTAIDATALHHFMSWHAVVPAPLTIIKGVRKLASGTVLIVEPDGSLREKKYWSVQIRSRSQDRSMREQDWRELVRESFQQAVKRRMVADVPVGVLLSGGLDSSMIVAALVEQGQQDLKTFSIGFDSIGDVQGDEFEYSDFVSKYFDTDHQQIRVSPSETLSALPETLKAMSEPMMSHDAVGFYILSREVSKQVKVVQSGQGADEVFGGYHWYQKLYQSNDISGDYQRIYFDREHDEMIEALDPDYLGEDHSGNYVDQYFDRSNGSSSVDKALQIDTEIMLVDDPVKRVDNMTMAWGLEGRVPFLDHELVELAGRIPGELKVRNGGKHILKEAARGLVPDRVIDRSKGYFPVPALKYLRGGFLDYARSVLHEPRAMSRGIFRKEYVDRLLRDPEKELTPKGHSKLWQVTVLEGWLQAHGL
jgi:asparagine synthase (glutamine-hydrolysing)